MNDDRIASIVSGLKNSGTSFIIGTAASAHQVEGNNENDWTTFEMIEGKIANHDVSGNAVDHYHLYDRDFQIMKDLGFTTHRLSIEWSRIYPKQDAINYEEVEHYRKVLEDMRSKNLLSLVTLHHFTSPNWFIEKGGFKKKKNLVYWREFVITICKELGELIDVFNTINEPFVYSTMSYFQGVHAPGEKGFIKYAKVGNNVVRAHFIAVAEIRKLCPGTPVGIVKNLINFNTKRGFNPINSIARKIMNWGYNKRPLQAIFKQRIPFGFQKIKEGDIGDFIGVNYYIKGTVGMRYPEFMLGHEENADRITQMGWGMHPDGLAVELRRLVKLTNLPIFITENGIATDDDEWRIEYIEAHLKQIIKLREEGIDIRGYYYWSILDNFEWAEGYFPKFGLVAVDRNTMERQIKPSGEVLGEISKRLPNTIDYTIFKK